MLDRPLLTAVRSVLVLGFAGSDHPETQVKQTRQPVQQGADRGPTVYFQKLFETEIGSPKRKLVWDPDALDYENHLVQKVATTFQISAIFKQTPESIGWTAGDLATHARGYLQNDAALAAFLFVGLGVERVSQIRNLGFTDGQEQFEFMPNFDFVLTHEQVTVSRTPGAVALEFDIERV